MYGVVGKFGYYESILVPQMVGVEISCERSVVGRSMGRLALLWGLAISTVVSSATCSALDAVQALVTV